MNDHPPPRPQLHAIEDEPDDPDQVPRLLAFRAAHPGITVELDGFWRAKIAANGETVVARYELRDVLDELARLFPGDW